jgi:hypothetical protein
MLTRRSLTTSLLAGSAATVVSNATSAKAETAISVRKSSPTGNLVFPTHCRTVDIDGVSIFYREAGAPGAPVVLLLHGWPSSSAMFRDLIRELSAGYHVLLRIIPASATATHPIARASAIHSTASTRSLASSSTRSASGNTFRTRRISEALSDIA